MSNLYESAPNYVAKIALKNVVKIFAGRKVLDDVSFTVSPSETLCILGRSGTGKSVTLKMMIGLLNPDSGSVLIDGNDLVTINDGKLEKLRRKMGFMFQNAALFDSFSLTDNLALPLRRLHKSMSSLEVQRAVTAALEQVGLEKDGSKMPGALSGGMQKRAGLARALVLKPEILLIDEPSSGLDRITASEITELLYQIKSDGQTTIVMVTHDIHGARRLADKFAVLDDGKVLAVGSPEELDKKQDKKLQQFISEP